MSLHCWSEALEGRLLLTGDLDLTQAIGGLGSDSVQAMASDSAGNLYVAGSFTGAATVGSASLSSRGLADAFVAKLSPAGALLWVRTSGGKGADAATALAVDAKGNVWVAGAFSGKSVFGPAKGSPILSSQGQSDAFVWSLTAAGATRWARSAGGKGNDSAMDLAVSSAGRVAVGGCFQRTLSAQRSAPLESAGGTDGFLWLLDTKATTLGLRAIGGKGNDRLNGLAVDASGSLLVAGSFEGTADFDPSAKPALRRSAGRRDAFIARYTPDGKFSKVVTFGSAGDDEANGVAVDFRGSVYATGSFQGSVDFDPGPAANTLGSMSGTVDAFTLRLDRALRFSLAKATGSDGKDVGRRIAVDSSLAIFTVGSFENQPDFDPGGAVFRMQSSGGADGFVTKLAPSGKFVYARQVGGAGGDSTQALSISAAGQVLTGGAFTDYASLGTSPHIQHLQGAGAGDGYIARYAQSLPSYSFAKVMAQSGSKSAAAIAVDAADNTYVVAAFTGTITFTQSDGTTVSFTSHGGTDVFVGRFCTWCNYTWGQVFGGPGDDSPADLALTDDGKVLVTGRFEQTAGIDGDSHTLTSAGAGDAFVLTLDQATGGCFSSARFGGTGQDAGSAIVAAGAAACVAGTFEADASWGAGDHPLQSRGASDAFVARLDPNTGVVSWDASAGGSAADSATDLALDPSGNLYVAGLFRGPASFGNATTPPQLQGDAAADSAFLWKLRSSGLFADARQITAGGMTRPVVAAGEDGVYIAAGFAGTASVGALQSAGGTDILVARYDHAGGLTWARALGGAGNDSVAGIGLDSGGNVFLTGSFQGSADFDPAALNAIILASAGAEDAFLAKLSLAGDYQWAGRMGGTGSDRAAGLAVGGGGSFVYTTGTFSGSGNFDPTGGTVTLSASTSGLDSFMSRELF